MESLDSGHTTVKTENSQPGLSQGQDPSSRVLLRSTRVATHPLLFNSSGHGWLSGGYTVGTLSYGEEEFKFKFGMLDLTTLRLD